MINFKYISFLYKLLADELNLNVKIISALPEMKEINLVKSNVIFVLSPKGVILRSPQSCDSVIII